MAKSVLRCPKCGAKMEVPEQRSKTGTLRCLKCGYGFVEAPDDRASDAPAGKKSARPKAPRDENLEDEGVPRDEPDDQPPQQAGFEGYKSLLNDVESVSANDFAAVTHFGNPFEDRARRLQDRELAGRLRAAKSRDDAIRAVRERMEQLGLKEAGEDQAAEFEEEEEEEKPLAPPRPKVRPVPPRPVAQEFSPARQRCLEFPSAESLVRFLDVLLSRQDRDAHFGGQLFVWIPGADSKKMGLILPKPPAEISPGLSQLAALLSAVEGPVPAGTRLPLNEFLERVRLRTRANMPRHINSLFVHMPGAGPEEMARIYESFPRSDYVQCRFFMGQEEHQDDQPTGRRKHALILFEQLKSLSRISNWVSHLPPGATAFYPIGGTAQDEDVFFCQWNYLHPVAALSRLYDCSDCRYVLMSLPSGGARPWLKISREDAETAFVSSNQLFRIEVTRKDGQYAPSVMLEGREPDEPIDLPLRAVRSGHHGLAQAGPLARQIEALRRKLADLEARYESVQQIALGQCRVGLVFYQGDDGDLPPRLKRFLLRPYQTLDSYTYFYLPSGANERHILFSKTPVSLADALVACSDEVYVQEPRWQGWGLNVFLRHGVELSPRLDDPAMAEQFREFFGPGGASDRAECLLVDVPGVTGKFDKHPLAIAAIPKTTPLPDRIRFFNEQFADDVRHAVEQYPEVQKASLDVRGLEVADRMADLHHAMTSDLDAAVRSTDDEWRRVHARNDKVVGDVRQSSDDIKKIEELLAKLPVTWEAFAAKVLATHLELSVAKRGALHELGTNLEQFEQSVKTALGANEAASTRISEASAAVRAATANLDVVERDVRSRLTALQGEYKEFAGRRTQANQEVTTAATALRNGLAEATRQERQYDQQARQLESQLAALRSARERLDRKLKDNQARKAKADGQEADIARKKEQDEAEGKEIETRRALIQQQEEELQREKDQIKRQREDVEREIRENSGKKKATIDDWRREKETALSECRRENEAVLTECRRAFDDLRKTLTDAQRMRNTRKRFKILLDGMAEVFDHKPTTLGRLAAMRRFWEILKRAPREFYAGGTVPSTTNGSPQNGK